ncbi:glycosyltransferase family 4 protein [Algoriphagus antarcticus]|uniref:Glycosyltransferase involved in cell wall biosynthesis n=1 Tax=Algoriphagus antarcticus TaxID=238540 RepID=A0A3E0DFD4_9BACT|nr:glycosyltransferase family 1 protein [Algoriphagus antarcticus]REG81418.1 glycosyltransferase involved in cell wall biosynthesis [Algoriphagus antarcticus]
MKNICIDLTNIVPGKGGAGGGIATYGKELILGIDDLLGGNENLRQSCNVTVLLNTHTYKNLEFKHLNTRYFNVDNQNFFSRMYWLQIRLPNFLERENMDLLHRLLSELPIRKVCKYVVTVHDFMFEFYLKKTEYLTYLKVKDRLKFKVLNGLLSSAIRTSDLVITNSKTISSDVISRFPGVHSKTAPILLGYSQSSEVYTSEHSNALDSVIRFGVVAAFHPHKGHLQVIRLVKRMIALGFENSFHFYFRGSPVFREYYDKIKREISIAGLDGYFTFEQYVPAITLADIYNSYTATVLLSDYEGFGLPVIESQAFGRPVICSEIPVFKEILGDTAFFLAKDPTDLDIIKLMSDLKNPELIHALIRKGKQNASLYTWSKTCQNTMEAYFHLLTKD